MSCRAYGVRSPPQFRQQNSLLKLIDILDVKRITLHGTREKKVQVGNGAIGKKFPLQKPRGGKKLK